MKYNATSILRSSFKKCLFDPVQTTSVGGPFFHVKRLNVVANSADVDENVHKEQSG